MRRGPLASMDDMDDEGGFLTTYADLVTLLLVFFVMLYGMSSTDTQKFRGASASIRRALGQKPTKSADPVGPPQVDAGVASKRDLAEALHTLKEHLDDKPIQIFQEGKHIRIRVDDQLLFRSGSAELMGDARDLFTALTKALRPHWDYAIHIEGHTDNQPISNSRYPSNWELSAIRATTVLRVLIELGVEPKRLTATGYGALLPLVSNDTRKHRAKNRRVELVLEMEAKR